MTGLKTDNRNLDWKVTLRRLVLERAHFSDLRVLDLCAGEGTIWRAMQKWRPLDRYMPVDVAPRQPGTLAGDILEPHFLAGLPFHQFNVLDIDTYGEPWVPWRYFFEKQIRRRTAVFLTHGTSGAGTGTTTSKFTLERLGIPPAWQPDLPLKRELAVFAAPYLLLQPSPLARIVKGWKISLVHVTYYGLLCEPKRKSHLVPGRSDALPT